MYSTSHREWDGDHYKMKPTTFNPYYNPHVVSYNFSEGSENVEEDLLACVRWERDVIIKNSVFQKTEE